MRKRLVCLALPLLLPACSLGESPLERRAAAPVAGANEHLPPPEPGTEVIAKGRIENLPWRLEAYRGNDGVCVDLRVLSNSSGGCGSVSDPKQHLVVSGIGWSNELPNLAQLNGQVSPRVAKLMIRTATRSKQVEVHPSKRFGGVHFVAFVPLDQAVTLTAHDDDGNVLKRRTLTLSELNPSL